MCSDGTKKGSKSLTVQVKLIAQIFLNFKLITQMFISDNTAGKKY